MPSIRFTQGMEYLQALGNLHRNYGRLFENQGAIASGRRIQTASDDPTGTARILEYARRAGDLTEYRSNISAGQSALESASADLQSIADVFHQARERVVQALSGTASDEDREIIANELEQHLVSMLGYVNTQAGGRYVFAGSRTDSIPFVRKTGVDGIERVQYVGDDLRNRAEVGPGLSEPINIPGSRLIDVGPRAATSFFGSTGARPGTGSDSGVGRAQLTVGHTVTGFGPYPGSPNHPASGLKTGSSSAALDTILGFSHVLDLTVNATGTGGTVSLNGGTVVSFASTAAEVAVKGPGGETVYLDVSSLTAGFSGPVPLVSYGTFSLDGGQTAVPINFGATGQVLIDPADGSVTHVDATSIRQTGIEDITYGGTLDLFNAMLAIRDLLRTKGSQQQITAALAQARQRLDDLDRGEEAILRTLADAGASSNRLTGLDQRMADLAVTVAARRSEIEDVDLTTVLTDLQENEAVYQSSLLVTARLSRISLANYLA